MPRNSAGVFTLPAGNPVIPDTVIESVWANTTLEDVALALTQSLARSGVGGMLGQFKSVDGTEGEPGIGFLGELDTGFYLAAPGDLRMTLSGQDLFRWYNGAVWVWRASTSTWEKVVASNSISVDDDGNVTIDGDLTVTGDTNVGGNLTVDGDTVLGGTTTIDNVIVNGNTTIVAQPVTSNRPYRYWRMDMMDSADSMNASLAEIELAIGELPVQTLASISAIAGVSNIFRLNDGQTNLSSAISINGSPSIVWDFGAATPQPLTYIRQFPGPATGGLTAFRISASDDGVNWAILNGFSGLSPVLEEWSEPYYIFPQGVEEAPIDGTPYARQDAGWVPAGGGGGLQLLEGDPLSPGSYFATVGTGGDFPTLKAAMDFLKSHPMPGEQLDGVSIVLLGGAASGYDNWLSSQVLLPSLGYPVRIFGTSPGSGDLDFESARLIVDGNYTFSDVEITCSELLVTGKFGFAFSTLNASLLLTGNVVQQLLAGAIELNNATLNVGEVRIGTGGTFLSRGTCTLASGCYGNFEGCQVNFQTLVIDDTSLDFYHQARGYINFLDVQSNNSFGYDVSAALGAMVTVTGSSGNPTYSLIPGSIDTPSGSAIWA